MPQPVVARQLTQPRAARLLAFGLIAAAGGLLAGATGLSRATAQGLATPPAPQLPARSADGSRPAAAPAPAAPAAAAPAGGGMVTIESDQQQADNRTGIVTASGNVRILYPERGLKATARQAQYFSREARLVLSGDVEVIDADGQRIRAERLVYRLDSERLQAEPGAGRQVVSKLRLQGPPGQVPRPPLP